MSNQHEALRLADELDRMYDQLDPVDDWRPIIDAAGEALRQIPRLNAVGSPVEHQVRRLRRKLEKRDEKIAGLKRCIADLEHALAVKDVEVKRLPRDVTRAVQEALCNVRMIPVLGIGKDARILEVKSSDA